MHCCQKLALILPLLLAVACQDKDKETEYRYIDAQGNPVQDPAGTGQLNPAECKQELKLQCSDVQTKIDAKQKEIDAAIAANDKTSLYAAQLDLNELLEIRDSYQKGNADVAPIQQRYTSLRELLAATNGTPGEMSAISYHKEELAAVREVFDAIGELTIDPKVVVDNAADKSKTVILSAQEAGTPWAAYWYPRRGKDMFEASNAPLRKLDSWLKKQSRTSTIVDWEVDHYDAAAAEWEGLCDAWAMAAVSTFEPKKAVKMDGVEFSPSDLKAIAIKYFEGYDAKVYGRRYQGVASTDGLIQDLRPEAFHRLIEEYLGNKKQPIIVDEDPGPEVWSKPVFRMAFSISKDPVKPQALLVKAYPWMTRQRASVDDAPTSLATDLAAPTYEYRLYYDSKPTDDGRWKIIAGEWLGSSLNFHPDMVFLPAAKENTDQSNPEMKKYNSDIRKLLELAGMIKP